MYIISHSECHILELSSKPDFIHISFDNSAIYHEELRIDLIIDSRMTFIVLENTFIHKCVYRWHCLMCQAKIFTQFTLLFIKKNHKHYELFNNLYSLTRDLRIYYTYGHRPTCLRSIDLKRLQVYFKNGSRNHYIGEDLHRRKFRFFWFPSKSCCRAIKFHRKLNTN